MWVLILAPLQLIKVAEILNFNRYRQLINDFIAPLYEGDEDVAIKAKFYDF